MAEVGPEIHSKKSNVVISLNKGVHWTLIIRGHKIPSPKSVLRTTLLIGVTWTPNSSVIYFQHWLSGLIQHHQSVSNQHHLRVFKICYTEEQCGRHCHREFGFGKTTSTPFQCVVTGEHCSRVLSQLNTVSDTLLFGVAWKVHWFLVLGFCRNIAKECSSWPIVFWTPKKSVHEEGTLIFGVLADASTYGDLLPPPPKATAIFEICHFEFEHFLKYLRSPRDHTQICGGVCGYAQSYGGFVNTTQIFTVP